MPVQLRLDPPRCVGREADLFDAVVLGLRPSRGTRVRVKGWGAGEAVGFGDIFGEIVGGQCGGRSSVYRRADLRYNLQIAL